MKYVRLWFVALLVVALMRSEPFYSNAPVERSISMWIDLREMPCVPPQVPPMPEQGPWINLNMLLGKPEVSE